ncbi:peptidyl-arginine hydroxylation [Fragilaria crotonensis]|nr:peptidyl-arginine hydroxylation [Fragilaria crotonensis]
MTEYIGPSFQLVDQIDAKDLDKVGGFGLRTTPLLVKGAVKDWPAWQRWSFEYLASLRRPDGKEVVFGFQDGVREQGSDNDEPVLPVAPYIALLGEAARQPHPVDGGLLTADRYAKLKPGISETFHLDWSYMQSFKADKLHLSQWNILDEFPHLKKDFAIRELWPGCRFCWEYVFIGPAKTVTGLHYDFPNNWFCQARGTKEVLLFTPDQSKYMCESKRYEWGAFLSDIDISRLPSQPRESAEFAKAHGRYARVEAGDALFIPKGCWHCVVALEPSVSLAVFGLTIPEILLQGGYQEVLRILHATGLYAKGNCTCHKAVPT